MLRVSQFHWRARMKPKKSETGHYGITVKYAGDENQKFLQEFKNVNNVVKTYGVDLKVIDFKPEEYRFQDILRKHLQDNFGVDINKLDLEKLHEHIDDSDKALDQSELNNVSKSFYELGEEFLKEYRKFMSFEVSKYLKDTYYIQNTPTLRCHMPNQKGFDWKPRFHTDIMLGHPPAEVNVWVPFTKCFGTNSMMIASLDDSMNIISELDYDFEKLALLSQTDEIFSARVKNIMKPVDLDFGQFIVFDPRCLHATQFNETDSTRISMDVRYIAKQDEMISPIDYRGTGRLKMQFKAGHYYSSQEYPVQ